jgi:hypothetical protein
VLVLLSFTTFQHTPYFSNRETVAIVRTQFLRAALENKCEIVAYGFADDCAELLVETIGDQRAAFVCFRGYSACAFRIRRERPLWTRDIREAIIVEGEAVMDCMRRLFTAPVNGSFAWDRAATLIRPESSRFRND